MTLQADFTAAQEEIAVKRAALKSLFDKVNDEKDETKRHDLAGSIKSANTELADLVDKIEPLQEMLGIEKANSEALKAMRGPGKRQVAPESEDVDSAISSSDEVMAFGYKSVYKLLAGELQASGRKSFNGYRGDLGELALKTLIASSSIAPLEERLAMQPSPQEVATTSDLMLQGTTTAQKIGYFVETTFTNAAVETDEGALKGEGVLDFTLREDSVRKIATWIPVTDETLDDIPTFESYLTGRLGFMVKRREELQVLRGDGVGLNIQGLYNRTGVNVVTGYGMSTIDSILKGISVVQSVGFAEPTAMVVHPNDWFDIRTSKATGTGEYLLGPAYQSPDVRPWGLQVRVTTAALENSLLLGAFTPHAQIFRRAGISIAISTENEDYFTKNKVAVRAEERIALAVYRPSAFAVVQAIVQGS